MGSTFTRTRSCTLLRSIRLSSIGSPLAISGKLLGSFDLVIGDLKLCFVFVEELWRDLSKIIGLYCKVNWGNLQEISSFLRLSSRCCWYLLRFFSSCVLFRGLRYFIRSSNYLISLWYRLPWRCFNPWVHPAAIRSRSVYQPLPGGLR